MAVLPITIAITMHVRRAKCSSSIHINAVVERVRCPSCGQIEQIPASRWRTFLDTAVNDGPSLGHHEAEIRYDDDEAWIIAKNEQPKCDACGVRFPKESAHNARVNGKCFCVGCGAKTGVRQVPPELMGALPCITHILAEDGMQLKTPDAAIPNPGDVVSVKCPDCGGAIQPDGKSRSVRCPFCSILVVLPQNVWRRLHTGDNNPHTFYLIHDPTLPRPASRADAQWSSVRDVTCDAYGNVYVIAEHDAFSDDTLMAFALDNQLGTKWMHKGLKLSNEAQIAWRNDGVLLLWSKDRYSAILLRAGDGQDLGRLGGEQPPGAQNHMLDLSRAEGLAIDHDGTILFSKRDRLARCAPDGGPTTTWPPATGFLASLHVDKMKPFTEHDEDDAPSMRVVGDRPLTLDDHMIRIGWDGRSYHMRSGHIVCFDRSGKKLFNCEVPDDMGSIKTFGVDARGIVYVLCHAESSTSQIHRIINGAISPFIDGRNPATPIRDDRHLTVHPDGTMILIEYDRKIRVFAPSGQMLFASPNAREEDKEHAKRLAKERESDRVR